MDTHTEGQGAVQATVSPEEWQARVDLAAVYRLVEHHGWAGDIFNHCSMRVPGEARMFLIKRHELLYTEVTASNLAKVDMDLDLDERSGVNRPGFTLHSGVLGGRADVNCAVHIHTDTGMALSALKDGLRMLSQNAVRFHNRIGYHDFEGITETFDERDRIVKDLGQNRAMILRNHGLLTVGATAPEAYKLMKYLFSSATIQLTLQATGQQLVEIPAKLCEAAAEQYARHDRGRATADWPAALRMLDAIDASYKT